MGGEEGRPKLELTFRQKVNAQYAAVLGLAFIVRWKREPTDGEKAEMLQVAKVLTAAEVDMVARWLAGDEPLQL